MNIATVEVESEQRGDDNSVSVMPGGASQSCWM